MFKSITGVIGSLLHTGHTVACPKSKTKNRKEKKRQSEEMFDHWSSSSIAGAGDTLHKASCREQKPVRCVVMVIYPGYVSLGQSLEEWVGGGGKLS